MKKVFQTIVDKGNGNCMQAVIASLFDKNLDEVPHFLELGEQWYYAMEKIYCENGYNELCFINRKIEVDGTKEPITCLIESAKYDQGVNGYFYGVVNSLTFENTTHAVIVDINLNIVHDPNPNGLALKLTPDDVIGIYTCNKDFFILNNEDGSFKEIISKEEYFKD